MCECVFVSSISCFRYCYFDWAILTIQIRYEDIVSIDWKEAGEMHGTTKANAYFFSGWIDRGRKIESTTKVPFQSVEENLLSRARKHVQITWATCIAA